MPLVNMRDMLNHVYQHGYAVGAFDLVSLDFLEGIILAISEAGSPVEHLIIYNVQGITKDETLDMIGEGKTILNTIPGVLEIVTGRSIQDDDSYRHTWLIRFCHRAVIESYKNHHLHVAFADTLFRPVAGERISIDYQTH